MTFKRIFTVLLTVLLLLAAAACVTGGQPGSSMQPTTTSASPTATPTDPPQATAEPTPSVLLPEIDGYYYDVANVVLYLELYGQLPSNFITKAEARELGWNGGSVEDYREGAAIGGDFFGNYEELLPIANGRSYRECDIDTHLANGRGAKRVVFSNDGLYFYTSDHYESFSEITITEDYEVIW